MPHNPSPRQDARTGDASGFPNLKPPALSNPALGSTYFRVCPIRGCDDPRLIQDYPGLCAFTYTVHYTRVAGSRDSGADQYWPLARLCGH
jgi:hypothetical protein